MEIYRKLCTIVPKHKRSLYPYNKWDADKIHFTEKEIKLSLRGRGIYKELSKKIVAGGGKEEKIIVI